MEQRGRRLTVFNLKGGVGKTGIAVNLALTLGMGLMTNDVYTPLEIPFPEEQFLRIDRTDSFPDLPPDADIVYDLGGHPDPRIVRVLRSSDWVVVPTENEFRSLQITLRSIAEVREYTPNIVVIANKLKPGDLEDIERIIQGKAIGHGAPPPILPLKFSTAFNHVFERGEPLRDIVAQGGQLGYAFAGVNRQFEALLDFLNRQPNV